MRPLAVALVLLSPLAAAADGLPAGAVARLGSPGLRHAERPLALALDAAGTRLASGGPDGSVKLWDTATGKPLGTYKVKDGYASSVAMSADATLVAARFGDGRIHLIDGRTMKARRVIDVPNADAVTLSADGKLVAAVAGQTVHVHETANGLERLQPLPGRAAAFTPNGARLARAETGEVVRTTDVLSGENLAARTHLSREGVTALAWSADGETLLSADGGETGRVRLWRAGGEQPVAEWRADGAFAAFAGEQVVGRHGGRVVVWDRAGKVERAFANGMSTLAVSGDGKVVATAGSGPRIGIWDVATGTQKWVEPNDLGTVRAVGAEADGRVLVAAERGIVAWRPGEAPTPLVRTPAAALAAVGPTHAFTVADGKLHVWAKAAADAPVRTFDLGPATPVSICAAGGGAFVAFDDKTVRGFDVTAGPGRAWATPAVLLSMTADARRLAAVGRDGFGRAWALDGEDPRPLWAIRVTRSLRPAVAVSPAGDRVAVTSAVRMEVFDAATGGRQFLGERTWHDGPFQAVAFSPDGRLVAAGMQGSGGGLGVWDAATTTLIARFEGGGGSVTKVLFLPDGRLVSAAADDNLLVWELLPKQVALPTDADLAAAWDGLRNPDGRAGLETVHRLAAGGQRAVVVVRRGLAEVAELQAKLPGLLKDLGDPAFATREAAQKSLLKLGGRALPAVREAVQTSGDPEVVRRAEKLVGLIENEGRFLPAAALYGDRLCVYRAVWALELIGTPAARKQLEAMRAAKLSGAEGVPAALERMMK